MPRPKKPHNLKVISGSREPSSPPVIDFPLVKDVPSPPDWLPNHHAVTEWHRLAPILVANRLLSEAGLTMLGHACALHGVITQMLAAGIPPTASMIGSLRNMMNDWGVTAMAAGKVTPSGEEVAGNAFKQRGAANRSA